MAEPTDELEEKEWRERSNEVFRRLVSPEFKTHITEWTNDELITRKTSPDLVLTALCGALGDIIATLYLHFRSINPNIDQNSVAKDMGQALEQNILRAIRRGTN